MRTVASREIGTGISEASKRVSIFSLLLRKASERVPIFDKGTGSKPARVRSGSLQEDLSLIVKSDPPTRVSVQAPRCFVIYDSQFSLASSKFGQDFI